MALWWYDVCVESGGDFMVLDAIDGVGRGGMGGIVIQDSGAPHAQVSTAMRSIPPLTVKLLSDTCSSFNELLHTIIT